MVGLKVGLVNAANLWAPLCRPASDVTRLPAQPHVLCIASSLFVIDTA